MVRNLKKYFLQLYINTPLINALNGVLIRERDLSKFETTRHES